MDTRQSLGLRPNSLGPFCATLLLTFTFTNLVLAAPQQGTEGLGLKYEISKSYIYEYETKSVVKLLGTSDEESLVQLKGQVILTPWQESGSANGPSWKKHYVLTLGDFALDVTSPNEKVATSIAALKGSTSRFTTDGSGIIQDFYVENDQSSWVSNYHRGIASAFSNYALKDSQQAFYLETDVSGSNCPTEYKISADGTYTKRRDLNKCLDRDGGYTEVYGVPYSSYPEDEPTSDTSIRSSQECVQKFVSGILNSGECNEVHRVTLFASGKDNGGNAQVSAKITLKKTEGSKPVDRLPTKLSSILFDHTGTNLRPIADATEIIEALVGKLCLSTGTNGRLSADTSSVFLTLKSKIRVASKQVLENVYNKLKSGKICDATGSKLQDLVKLYTDAVLMGGSTDSIAFGAQLVQSGQVSKNSEKRFRLFTALADRPGEAALESIGKLLDGVKSGSTDSIYLLTASGIAFQYCLASKEDCLSKKAYVGLVDKIASITTTNCQNSANPPEKVARAAVHGLQALGNLKKLTPSAVATVESCLSQSDRIKIHALQAIRRDPCQEKVKVQARRLLKEQRTTPAHVRLSAYLALSQCYAKEDSDTIRSFIATEESIQVLSFIKSHRETVWAEKGNEAILDKGLFDGVNFEKVERDLRKFSSSLAFPDGLEDYSANVIYSDDSFLPKIINGNSTTKLFGQEFGLLEVGVHLGGFEQDLMEKAFNDDPSKFWEQRRRRSRGKRQATLNQNEIDVFHAKVKVPERKKVPTDFYLRLFGTTIYSNSFTFEDLSTKISRSDYMANLFDRAMKGEEISFTEAYPLVGDELIVPTVSGLSLWIHNEGAAILSLKYAHTVTENFEIFKPKLSPGISVTNKMKLSIAGDLIEAGLRVETKVAASTEFAMTGTLSATDDKYGYEIRVSMPPTDVKLIEASNELFWVLQTRHSDYDQKQKLTSKTTPSLDTGLVCTQYLQRVTGVKSCFQAQLPPNPGKKIPIFPLSGPAKVHLTLSPPAGAREVLVKFSASKPQQEGRLMRPFTIEIDAPGATESIKSIFNANIVKEGTTDKFSVELESPKIKAGFSATITEPIRGKLDISYKAYVDDKIYQLHFKRHHYQDTATPFLRISHGIRYQLPKQPEVTVFNLDLAVNLADAAKKIGVDLSLLVNDCTSAEVKELVAFSALISGPDDATGKTIEIKNRLSYRSKQLFLVKGTLTKSTPTTIAVNVDSIVNIKGQDEDLKINGDLSYGDSKKTGFKGSLNSVSRPVLSSDIEALIERPETDLTKIIFNLNSPKLSIKTLKTIDRRGGKFKVTYDGKGVSPELDLDQDKSYEIEVTDDKVLARYRLTSKGRNVIELKLNCDKTTKIYDADLAVILKGKSYSLKSKNSNAGGRLSFEHSIKAEGKFSATIKKEIYDTTDADGVWKNRETSLTSDAFPDPYTVKVKYNLAKAGNIKVIRGSTEIGNLDVSKKVEGDGTNSFSVSVFAEDVIRTESTIQRNAKQQRTTIRGLVQRPPGSGPERTLYLSVYGKHLDDKPGQKHFGFSFDFNKDAGKGSATQIKVRSENQWEKTGDDHSLLLLNTFEVYGKEREINLKLSGKKAQVSKFAITIDHTSPEGKKDKVEVSSEVEASPAKKYVTVNFNAFGRGGKYEVGLQNLNKAQATGDFLTKYTCVKDGVLFDITASSSIKDGGVRVFTTSGKGFKFILKEAIQHDLTLETGPGKHRLNFLGSCSTQAVYFNLNLEKIKGSALKKFILDVDFDKNYRKEAGPALTTKTTLAYRYAATNDFELQSTGNYVLKGEKSFSHEFTRSVKATPGSINVDFVSTLKLGSKEPDRDVLKVNAENNDKKGSISVNLEHRLLSKISGDSTVPPRIDFKFETTKNPKDLQLVLSLSLPSAKFQSGSIDARRTVSADGTTRASKISGKLNQQTVEVETTLVLTAPKKSVDISLKLNNEAPRKLSIKYNNAGGHVAEAKYTGVDGQAITSKGSVTEEANDGFTGQFEFDVPAINQQWSLEVSRQLTSAKKTLSFTAISAKTNQHVKFRFEKEKADLVTYSSTLNVDVASPNDKYDIDGTLKAVLGLDKPTKTVKVDLDYVVGAEKRSRSLSIDSSLAPTTKTCSIKLSLAPGNAYTFTSSLISEVKAPLTQNNFKLTLTNPAEGLDATVSASLALSEDRKERQTSFEYALTHKSLKSKKQLGVSLFKKPGTVNDLELTKAEVTAAPSKVSSRGIEITFPERSFAAQIVYADWSEAVDARAAEIILWFDKKNAPAQKLNIGYSLARASVNEPAQGKDLSFTIRHHKLQRDLKLKSKYRFTGGASKIVETQTELDIFKRPEDKLVFKWDVTHDVSADSYAIDHSVVSTGQGISLITKCDRVTMDFPRFSINCVILREVQNIRFNYKVKVQADNTGRLVQLHDGDNRVFFYEVKINRAGQSDNPSSAPSQSTSIVSQLQLPGMTDTRQISVHLSRKPFRFSLTTKPSSSKEDTNFWIGATSLQGGGWGLSRVDESGQKKDLASFSASVKAKKLHIDIDWSKENVASYLAYVVKRGQEIEELATKASNKLDKQEWEVRQAFRKTLKAASQDFEPLLQWYETELTEIGSKYGLGPVKLPRGSLLKDEPAAPESGLVIGLKKGNKRLQALAASINAFLDSLATKPTLPTPEAVKERSKKVREFAQKVANKIREILSNTKALKEKFPFLEKQATKLREKVVARVQGVLDETSDGLNELYPYPEVEHFLDHFHDYFEVALLEPEKISKANQTEMLNDLEKAVGKVLSKTYLIDFPQGRIRAKIPILSQLVEKGQAARDFGRSQSQCVREFYSDPTRILPPVNATAFILGSTDYVAFDGTKGKFGKMCQYLMASDFVTKKVSIVLNLNGVAEANGDGSTLFITDHKTSVGIIRGNNDEVLINGKVTSITSEPTRSGAFIAYKDGAFSIVEGDMGVTVGCMFPGVCAVQVSGIYHGKLQGVLGKFNNNPYDDLTLPTGQVSTNENSFQSSWKLNDKCSRSPESSRDAILLLQNALRRDDLNYDNFFSRSSSSPHQALAVLAMSSAPEVSPISFLSILLSSLFALLLARFY